MAQYMHSLDLAVTSGFQDATEVVGRAGNLSMEMPTTWVKLPKGPPSYDVVR